MPGTAATFDKQYGAEPEFDNHTGFPHRLMKGEFILTLELTANGAGSGAYGLQVEDEDGALSLKTIVNQHGHTALQGKDGTTPIALAQVSQADVFQVERKQDTLIFSAAQFGDPLQTIASVPAPAGQRLRVGKYGSGTTVRNLRWTVPAWPALVPYRDYLGSRLELLNVATGARDVFYSTREGIEAPNWTPDGKYIMFNSSGRIYRLDVATKVVSLIDTGTRIRNNNDHVISFDGKWLGISNHTAEFEGESIVYKLPIGGGEPQALTLKAPSYLHGWSPDGKYVIYTARRGGQFDIYRTTTDGVGAETQLTNTKGLDDGSEYAPDGKHIYFNSSRTGVMQLWRMGPDGSGQQQLTFDSFNNWFPHVSPDKRQLVFLSYLPSMQADQHPYYQHVYLRAMPAGGGTPKVVAYLYGGQGTINVPSWSPDGKTVAFISNSVFPAE